MHGESIYNCYSFRSLGGTLSAQIVQTIRSEGFPLTCYFFLGTLGMGTGHSQIFFVVVFAPHLKYYFFWADGFPFILDH